jgi:hypothetical protein
MSLYKSAQALNADDITDLGDEDEVIIYEPHQEENVVELEEAHPEAVEVSFKLPSLPGSDEREIEVSTDDEQKSEDKPVEIEVKDPWDWQSHGPNNFLSWVKDRFANVPRHSGETVGIERAISYLKRINNELSKAVSNDFDSKIDVSLLEAARKEIYSGIDRLEEALGKLEEPRSKKKKAELEVELKKEGQKTTAIHGIIVNVPLHISAIARAMINSTISGGKDIERSADYFIKKFKLTDRDQLELFQLLADMNFPVRRPRGLGLDEDFDPSSVDTIDFGPIYPS